MRRSIQDIKRKDDARRMYINFYKKKHGEYPPKKALNSWSKRYDDKKKNIAERLKDQNTFAYRLRYAMALKGVKTNDIAQNVYVSQTTAVGWRNGRYMPSVDSVILLSNYLGVSIDYLLKGVKLDIEDLKESIEEIYKRQFYCMHDLCEHDDPTAHDCTSCLYDAIKNCIEHEMRGETE